MKWTTVHAKRVESLLEELEAVQRRIAERAFEIFRSRGAQVGAALDDWLTAERQTVWKPPIEVCQRDDRLVIEAAAAGIEPGQLQIEATPETILLKAEVSHAHPADKGTVHVCEFQPGHLFRLVQLPVKIDPDVVKAEFHNGLVRITATTAKEQRARTVKVQAV